mmetsp:Transcript_91295/g.182049  ORF Transcript_91295/g.182049 Transcript_91295/m.182049 type:complete len:243 (-) Transcript_91295:165-893(-)
MALHGAPFQSPFWQPTIAAQRPFAAFYKLLLVCLIVYGYQNYTTPFHRAGGLVCALGFVLIETTWTSIATEDPITGALTVSFRPVRHGHSSFAQFWINVIFTPGLLFLYRSLVSQAFLLVPGFMQYVSIVRVLCFPVNIWCLEIIEGYLLMLFFGRNVAWEYRGPKAYFHGNITLEYYIPWCLLGGAVEAFYDYAIVPIVSVFQNAGVSKYILLAAAMMTAFLAPRMSIKAGLKALNGEKID